MDIMCGRRPRSATATIDHSQSRGRRPRSPTARSEGKRLRVDTNSPLPLLTSLTQLNYLTPTLPRIRETLKQDGRLERLMRLLRSFCFAPTTRKPNHYLRPLPGLCLPTTARTCSQPKELCQTCCLLLLVGSTMCREHRGQEFRTNSESRGPSRDAGCGGLHSRGVAG